MVVEFEPPVNFPLISRMSPRTNSVSTDFAPKRRTNFVSFVTFIVYATPLAATVSVTGGSVPLIAVSAAKIVVFSLCSLSARAAGAARNANNAPATTSAANHVSFRIGVFG